MKFWANRECEDSWYEVAEVGWGVVVFEQVTPSHRKASVGSGGSRDPRFVVAPPSVVCPTESI
eukprot:5093271-Amphidinium_carterae.1